MQLRLPIRFRGASLVDFPVLIQEFALNWLTTPQDGLLITGSVGTGKTHLAAALTRALLLIGQEALFRRAADLYMSMREAYSRNESEANLLEEYTKYRFVFIDDLGSGSLSDHERRITLEVLDRRINEMLPTCVTTNWSIEEIAERMDERIASRLQSFTVLRLDGKDHRAEL